ncbi:MAG TPA: DNA primase [Kiritimatiellae bacterium]|nr:DNA primase [Kiritimatiellia bacterium]
MSPISRKTVEEIRNAADIQTIIGNYIPLKRAGSGFKALCPFHREKTPSFHVNPQLQIYHCFGCGRGGDIFRFIMEYERVDFPTAVSLLADRLGIRLAYDSGSDRTPRTDRPSLFRLMSAAARYYHQILLKSPAAEAARVYLRKRRLWGEAVERFQLGYAPASGSGIISWARKQGFRIEQVAAAGLVIQRDRDAEGARYVERFRDRIMFPISDEVGRVVAFSARVLEDDPRPAKYVNSPDTAIFRKGRVLFGLSQARQAIVESKTAVVCEGQIDVIRCHLSGFPNAVASQGTAVTPEQASLIRRYADKAVVVLDADSAGQDAAVRAGRILLGAGLEVALVIIPADSDPDSLILQRGPDAFKAVLDNQTDILDFHFEILRHREDLRTQSGVSRTAAALLETILAAPSAIQWDFLLRRASALLGIDEAFLREELRRLRRRQPTPLIAEDPHFKEVPHPEEEISLAELLLKHHRECRELVSRYLHLEDLQDVHCRSIVLAALQADREENIRIPPDPASTDEPESQRLFAELLMRPSRVEGSEKTPQEAVREVLLVIRRKALKRKRAQIQRQLQYCSDKCETERLRLESKQLMVDVKLLEQGWERAVPLLEIQEIT